MCCRNTEAQEALHVTLAPWYRPPSHCVHLGWIHVHLSPAHNHSQVLNSLLFKGTLFRAQVELVLPQGFQHPSHYPPVLRQGVCEHQDVVQVDYDMAFINQLTQDMIHEGLKRGRGVGQPKEHHVWLEEPSVRDERSFPLISCLNPDVVVPPTNVQLSEDLGLFESIHQL